MRYMMIRSNLWPCPVSIWPLTLLVADSRYLEIILDWQKVTWSSPLSQGSGWASHWPPWFSYSQPDGCKSSCTNPPKTPGPSKSQACLTGHWMREFDNYLETLEYVTLSIACMYSGICAHLDRLTRCLRARISPVFCSASFSFIWTPRLSFRSSEIGSIESMIFIRLSSQMPNLTLVEIASEKVYFTKADGSSPTLMTPFSRCDFPVFEMEKERLSDSSSTTSREYGSS